MTKNLNQNLSFLPILWKPRSLAVPHKFSHLVFSNGLGSSSFNTLSAFFTCLKDEEESLSSPFIVVHTER